MPVKTWLPNKRAFEVPTPPGVPPLHGLFLMCGRRGAGKGVACTSLLRHYKRHGCADRIFWVSPTMGSNKAFLDELGVRPEDRLDTCDNAALETVMDAVQEEADAWADYLEQTKLWNKLTRAKDVDDIGLDVLTGADRKGLLEQGARRPKSRYGHRPVLHCVVDDCMGTPLMSGGTRSKLTNMCIKHRHLGDGLGCTLWICAQSWSAQGSMPRAIRENATGVALWHSPHEQQRVKMSEELCDRRGAQHFLDVYDGATQEDHAFLFVDFTSKQDRYRAGWNQVLQA
jgi:hypothetical protein